MLLIRIEGVFFGLHGLRLDCDRPGFVSGDSIFEHPADHLPLGDTQTGCNLHDLLVGMRGNSSEADPF